MEFPVGGGRDRGPICAGEVLGEEVGRAVFGLWGEVEFSISIERFDLRFLAVAAEGIGSIF